MCYMISEAARPFPTLPLFTTESYILQRNFAYHFHKCCSTLETCVQDQSCQITHGTVCREV